MRVEFSKWSVVLRADGISRWWAAPYFVIGATIIWYALASEEPRLQPYVPIGVLFGFAVALAGLFWLLPSATLVFDLAQQEVRETSYGLLGRKVKRLKFARIASIGIESLQDPKTKVVWATSAVLRRMDGKRWTIDGTKFPLIASLDSGRGSETLLRIGTVSGITVLDETKMCEQPAESA